MLRSWLAMLFGMWFLWGGGILWGTEHYALAAFSGILGAILAWWGWGKEH